MKKYDVLIVGAGLSGLSAALELSRKGHRVLVIDKSRFPRDKICGGFLGPENIPFLRDFGLEERLLENGVLSVDEMMMSSSGGAFVENTFDEGQSAFAVSRKLLDQIFLEKAIEQGVNFRPETMLHSNNNKEFVLRTNHSDLKETIWANCLVMATGAGEKMPRPFMSSQWIGFSALFEGGSLPANKVALHFMNKAHVGLNHLENSRLNVCGVIHRSRLKEANNNLGSLLELLCQENRFFKNHLEGAVRITGWKGMVIPFDNPVKTIRSNCFYVGDAAGMVDPVIGGGMSMAIKTGSFLGRLLNKYLLGSLELKEVQKRYEGYWAKHFGFKIKLSKFLGNLAHTSFWNESALRLFNLFPSFFDKLLAYHHPKSMSISNPKKKKAVLT